METCERAETFKKDRPTGVKMIHSIKKVEYLDGYRLRLYFKNHRVMIVDLQKVVNTAKEMLLPLKDPQFFKKVKCEYGTVVWPNGADLCPNFLYSIGRLEKGVGRRVKKTPLAAKNRIRSKSKIS